jgi:protein-disulfide isomerase-like protein with CxxC motif
MEELPPPPAARAGRSLEKFRAYTQGWLRVAEDEPRAPFVPWASDAGPPSHSVPAHAVAKAARALGADAGARMRDRLFRAYFTESRDISDRATLAALWREVGLDADGFAGERRPRDRAPGVRRSRGGDRVRRHRAFPRRASPSTTS